MSEAPTTTVMSKLEFITFRAFSGHSPTVTVAAARITHFESRKFRKLGCSEDFLVTFLFLDTGTELLVCESTEEVAHKLNEAAL